MSKLALIALLVVAAAGPAHADSPTAQYSLGRGEQPHAGVPFTLNVVVEGLDEAPQPEQPKLAAPGATITPLDARPNVSRSIQIINGQRSDSTRVTWVMRWRVTVAKEGKLKLPALTIVQGSKRATVSAAEVDLEAVPTTDTMKLSLALPDRPVFVGENLPVTLTWLFRAEPQSDPQFDVPLMAGDDFTIGTLPAAANQRALKFSAGSKELELPFKVDTVDEGGVRYNRLQVTFFAAPKRSGKIEVGGASVVAGLPVGRADIFGNSASRMFRVADVARTLEVKPLPETDRPGSFSGAVGTEFSIGVATSRSVVQLGEPVELAITVKSNERLDTLALGKLDGEGGLPKDRFTVPAEPPTGELSADGKSKTFKVTAQVTGPASEIPSIAFSYFDPVKGAYQTIHSDPIAVSVKGGSVVGAGDVVAAAPKSPAKSAAPEADLALVGADLALSGPGAVTDRPLGGGLLWLLVGLLYAVPLALLGFRSWQVRTRSRREDAAEVASARRAVEQQLARAAQDPARETAGPLAAALRTLARALERELDDGGLLARIETESFAPASAASPLSSDVRQRTEELVRRWIADARRAPKAVAAVGVALVVALWPAPAHAATKLEQGRAAYQDAMALTDASARKAAFGRAAEALAEVAAAEPDRPELLADWGNAALGTGDVATATLAYRRALAIDGGNARARRNLAWLRSRQPDTLRPADAGATDTLFFFHTWPRARRLLVGAAAFALGVLLFVPWGGRRRRALHGLAVLPLAIWLAMALSLVLEDRHGDDAVVMDAVVLRAADSAGAPAALTQPLPRGAEVTVLEHRDAWTKVRLPSGSAGWVPAGTVQRVAR